MGGDACKGAARLQWAETLARERHAWGRLQWAARLEVQRAQWRTPRSTMGAMAHADDGRGRLQWRTPTTPTTVLQRTTSTSKIQDKEGIPPD